MLGAPVEFVNLRAVGTGRTVQASLDAGHTDQVKAGTKATAASTRKVRVERTAGGDQAVAIYEGRDLVPGHTLEGPALIEGIDTTVWVPALAKVKTDRAGNLFHGVSTMNTIDPITLEVLRSRLEAIGDEAAAALERTAISPVVTESKDYSCTILDAEGRLIMGAGHDPVPFRSCGERRAVHHGTLPGFDR